MSPGSSPSLEIYANKWSDKWAESYVKLFIMDRNRLSKM